MGSSIFWYYIAAYSIGLPTLASIAIAYANERDPRLLRFFAFFLSITLQLICIAVLRFQDAIQLPIASPDASAIARRAYFLSESTLIATLPPLCHALTSGSRSSWRDRLFYLLFALAVGILLSPYAFRFEEASGAFRALPGFVAYRILYFVCLCYGVLLLALKFRTFASGPLRAFTALALCSLALSLWEILHCELFPVLPRSHQPIPLSPAAYFASCVSFIVYMARRQFSTRRDRGEKASPPDADGLGMSGREREIASLLSQGLKNREIGEKLFISESTVKTHVKSIYRKLGVANRVELVHALSRGLRPPSKG